MVKADWWNPLPWSYNWLEFSGSHAIPPKTWICSMICPPHEWPCEPNTRQNKHLKMFMTVCDGFWYWSRCRTARLWYIPIVNVGKNSNICSETPNELLQNRTDWQHCTQALPEPFSTSSQTAQQAQLPFLPLDPSRPVRDNPNKMKEPAAEMLQGFMGKHRKGESSKYAMMHTLSSADRAVTMTLSPKLYIMTHLQLAYCNLQYFF